MPSKYAFADRGHVLKQEAERALDDPEWFARQMAAAHSTGNGPQPLQIRLQGSIEDVLTLAGRLSDELGLEASIRKMEVDKQRRVGNYDADNVFVYLSPEGSVRDHDEITDRERVLRRLTCPRCHMLLSVRESREGRCGNCGAAVEEDTG